MGNKVNGTLLIIGGAEDKEGKCEILREFIRLAGGPEANLVIITTATLEPDRAGKKYQGLFEQLGAGIVQALELDSREKANNRCIVEKMAKATGIFFTGGDQLRITSILGGTTANEALQKAYRRGAVIAGTSAGASVMSNTMIVEGNSDEAPKLNSIKLAPGLGLLEEVVIDQHFAQRGRIGRLLSAVAHNPYILGMGVDEDTAVIIRADARLEVIGSQTVTFMDGRGVSFTNVSELSPGQALAIDRVVLHVLPKGYGFDMAARVPVISDISGELKEGEGNGDN
ncbi:cyanophycinase [Phosphitispora fastidiosa]|uniref:cyanophycinase n=1 Tax=Phosphitispora fastidiosa TaxID=2837202 RepID=UPI001E5F0260|nr:cyanophycinase [Phosphitispora fastidiosa]MBU7007773.1 cyanophycinase [Phosphitispora fastidiosa]